MKGLSKWLKDKQGNIIMLGSLTKTVQNDIKYQGSV